MSTGTPHTPFLLALPTPVGRLEITSDGHAVTGVTREKGGELPHDGLRPRLDDVLHETAAQIDEYFSGDRQAFTVPISARATRYQTAVWEKLRAVSYGSTVTYGDLACAVTGRRAGRAAGRAVAASPILLLIPTHRVVSSRGSVTGYSGTDGNAAKEWLLNHEKAATARPQTTRTRL